MSIAFRSAIVALALFCVGQAGFAAGETNKPAAPAKPAAPQPVPEMKFTALLIWGTNGAKPDEANLKELDSACKEKLQKVGPFKWKDLYQVGDPHAFSLTPSGPKTRLKLSEKCEIEVEHKDGLSIELIGEGKSVQKVKHAMPLTDWLVVGGNDKGMNAWFVLIKPE